jgi:hypothetical protein
LKASSPKIILCANPVQVAELSMPAGISFARGDAQDDDSARVPAATVHLLQGDGFYRMARNADAVKSYADAINALWQRPRLEAEQRRLEDDTPVKVGPVDVVDLARLYSRTGAAQAAGLLHAESVVQGAASDTCVG